MDHRHHLDILLCNQNGAETTQLSICMRVRDAVAIPHDVMTVSLPLTLTASLKGTSCEIAGTWTGLVAGLFAQRGGRIKVPWFEQVPAVEPTESGTSATGTLCLRCTR